VFIGNNFRGHELRLNVPIHYLEIKGHQEQNAQCVTSQAGRVVWLKISEIRMAQIKSCFIPRYNYE
jgi:hypothetical protein